MKSLPQLRFWLEILALPVFVLFVIHLAGHGMMLLFEHGHSHGHGHETAGFLGFGLNEETGFGAFLALIFAWLWHRPFLRKWVPCRHDCCQHETQWPHILAIVALCLHFFPEAAVRHQLLSSVTLHDSVQIIGMVGFGAHFLIDVIVSLTLVSHWKQQFKRYLSFAAIAVVWIVAWELGPEMDHYISAETEGVISLTSAFLLAMFIHVPHRR